MIPVEYQKKTQFRTPHDSGGKSKKINSVRKKRRVPTKKKSGKTKHKQQNNTNHTATRDFPQLTEFLVMCIFQFLEQLTKASHCVTESVGAAVWKWPQPLRKSTIFRGQKKNPNRNESPSGMGWCVFFFQFENVDFLFFV